MKRMSRGLALTSLCLSLAACGTSKFYTLPVDTYRASETQTMIGACATEYRLESYRGENDIVAVKYDDTASVYYHFNGGDSANMQVVVDEKKVPGQELERKFAAVKTRGEDIYACAQMKLNPQPAPVVMAPVEPAPVQPAPVQHPGMSLEMNADMSGNMSVSMKTTMSASTTTSVSASASVGRGGSCAQAVECYAQLAKTVCEGASDCSFKAEVSGNDEAGCRDALRRVSELLQPFTMFRPGLSAPAICRAE
jgi:hypothetical protein